LKLSIKATGHLRPTTPSKIKVQNTTLSPQALRNLLEQQCTDAILENAEVGYLIELFKFWYDELEFA
jgi:hypothetical protein